MKIFRIVSETLETLLNRIVIVSGDSDNIAGLSVTLRYSLYRAKAYNRPIIFIYRPLYFPFIFSYIKIHSLKRKHAIFKLTSPYIDNNPWSILRFAIGNTVGAWSFIAFVLNIIKYKIGVLDQVLNYPRFYFAPRQLYSLESLCATQNLSPSDITEYDYSVNLNAIDSAKCQTYFNELGLLNHKFVCLHIRTMNYKGTLDDENNGFRNASPQSYIPAIKYLISKGFIVVRLGDVVPNMLPNIDGYIDYANSSYKSEEMDIFLIKKASFYFGTNSGIYDLALLLQTPMLTVNTTEMLGAKPYHRLDVMIYKRVKVRGACQPLSMKEYLKLNSLSLAEIEFIDNEPQDMIEAIDQMLTNLKGQKINNTVLDTDFREMQKIAVTRWAEKYKKDAENAVTYMNPVDELDRFASGHHYCGANGRAFIGKYFL
jgi:putative glycosyltransferase (TIGR04372 family)